jgi:succinoglycan biosynthesis transport protein ExoP
MNPLQSVSASSSASRTDGFDIRDYLGIIRRRKAWILLTALSVFVCTAVMAHRLPNIYRSETVILVDAEQVSSAYVASTVSSTIQDRLGTIQLQVMSPAHLKKMVDKLGLYPSLRGRVSDARLARKIEKATAIEVVNPGAGRLSSFKIAFQDESPVVAARVANELAGTFIKENLRARQEQFEGTAEFLDNELQDTKKQLEAKEGELSAVKSTFVADLPEAKQYHVEALAGLRMQMTASQDRIERAQQDKVVIQSMMSSATTTVDLDTDGAGPAASPYQIQIQKMETHLAELKGRYGSNFPDVRKTQADLDRLKKQAAVEEAQNPPPPAAEPTPPKKNPVLEAQLQKLDQEIGDQTKLQADLQRQTDFHVSKLEQAPAFEQKIADLTRDYESLKTHYQTLLDKKLAAQMSTELEERQKGERFTILDPATVPDQPSGPNRMLITFAGLLGGVFGGFGLAMLLEMTDASVRTESKATKLLGSPVLAGIPQVYSASQLRNRKLRFASAAILAVTCSAALGVLAPYLGGLIGL